MESAQRDPHPYFGCLDENKRKGWKEREGKRERDDSS